MNKIRAFFGYRMLALIRKEFRQILRDRRLAISLILPPTLQLLLFGFALNATVSNLRLGVVDDSRTPESRELVAIMTESKSFKGAGRYIRRERNEQENCGRQSGCRARDPVRLRARSAARPARHRAGAAERHEFQHGYDRRRIRARCDRVLQPDARGRWNSRAVSGDRRAEREPSRHGPAASGVLVQSGARAHVVYRNRHSRRAPDSERLADFRSGDCEGTRGRARSSSY